MPSQTAGALLRTARGHSGLTQRELARRARTSQSVIARIEKDSVSPSWRTLERLISLAGFELQVTINPKLRGRSHMLNDVPRILRLTPEQRLLELRNADRFFGSAKRVDRGPVRP